MTTKTMQQILLKAVCLTLTATGPVKLALAFQSPTPPQTQPSSSTSPASATPAPPAVAPLTSDELNSLVAPIALYPDALVAQVLGAANFPDQVAFADDWVAQNKSLTGSALTQAVGQQTWDPSVKALTQFPSVLDDLAKNLAWTSSLGQAFSNQQADVMAAVQAMRAQAQAAGNLKSTSQIQVVQQTPQTIVIQPASPDVVYVPQYNPAVVFGTPYVVPYYHPVFAVAVAGLSFGSGINIGVGFGGGGFIGGGFGWGFHAWNCNWGGGGGGGNIIYNHNTYIHNSTNIHNTVINNRTNYNGYHPWGPGPHGQGPYGPHPYNPNGIRPNGGYGPNGNHNAMNGGRDGDHGVPNGGRNGNDGRIGGDGGVEHRQGDDYGQRGNSWNGDHQRSGMSGDGGRERAESDRGRNSMRQAHMGGKRGGGGNRGGGGGPHGGGGGGRRR